MLSERRQRVLAAVIEEYVANALPVASRTLVDRYGLGVSSATVRNELSVLEDDGYITQPHTSAGRIPTDHGYRSFVDDLLKSESLDGDESIRETVRSLRENARELDELMARSSRLLAQLTESLAMVLPPRALSLQLTQLSLVMVGEQRLVLVLVAETGQVFNRTFATDEVLRSEEVRALEALLNSLFVGKAVIEMRELLDLEANPALETPLARQVLRELFRCLEEDEGLHSHRLGLPTLLKQPEFRHSSGLVPILQALEDESIATTIIDRTEGRDVTVSIGHENSFDFLSNFSVVTARFGAGEGGGIIAVIGPTRLHYGRVIKAVRSIQQELDDL